jgi:2-polyprenyl-6-methoxyphenol hydroxylase-like FAD-dependent oxidoreductase
MEMRMTSGNTEILIAGAGPVGLLLAGDLATAGVPVTVLERREGTSNLSRAFAVHARTLEMLDARDQADELIGTGQKLDHLGLFGTVQIDLSRLPTRFPFVLSTPQYETERLLTQRARSAGATILGGHELTGLSQDDGRVRVEVRAADGSAHTREAAYVVGCDGARSTVRHALGLPFPGRSVLRSVIPNPWTWTRCARSPGRRLAATSGCMIPAGCRGSTTTSGRSRTTGRAGCSWRATPRTCTPRPAARA